jgi:tetratricopeptide (TPR) repeat protein
VDFLNFEDHDLYFDEQMCASDEALLNKAAEAYPDEKAEVILLEMQSRLPDNLTVIVALYRFYYYQHRYEEALDIASKALDVSAAMMGIRMEWSDVTLSHLGESVLVSMGLIRFYMLSLKASAYLLLRMNNIEEAYARLKKVVDLDPSDQFGATFLFEMAERECSARQARQHNIQSLFQR